MTWSRGGLPANNVMPERQSGRPSSGSCDTHKASNRWTMPRERRRQSRLSDVCCQIQIPVRPLIEEVSGHLRTALKARFDELADATERTLKELGATDDFSALDAGDRTEILSTVGLSTFTAPEISTMSCFSDCLTRLPCRVGATSLNFFRHAPQRLALWPQRSTSRRL